MVEFDPMLLSKKYNDGHMIGIMLALFVFLASCSKDPTDITDPIDPIDPIDTTNNPVDTTNALTDSLAGLYKGQCYKRSYHLDLPGGWTFTLDTFYFEFEFISISDDTSWIFFDADAVFTNSLYREYHNRVNHVTDSLVYDGHVGLDVFYDIIVYPDPHKITFLEFAIPNGGPDYWYTDCVCLMR